MFSINQIKRNNADPDKTAKARNFAVDNPRTAKEIGMSDLIAAYDRLRDEVDRISKSVTKVSRRR